jgi:hypothetical protein
MFLVLLLVLTTFATAVSAAGTFSSTNYFAIPEYNSRINFAGEGSYQSADLRNSTWYFGSLYVNDSINGDLAVSAQNCSLTITHFDSAFLNSNGWLNYTVEGFGNQTFNLTPWFPFGTSIYAWYVNIDGVYKAQSDGWTLSDDNAWVTVESATSNASIYFQENPAPPTPAISFTPNTYFPIPESNSRINFGNKGTYQSAIFENNTWHFTGLLLNGSLTLDFTAINGDTTATMLTYSTNGGALSVSSQNSNITITSYDLLIWYAPFSGWLNYTVSGEGNQTININSGSTQAPIEWTAYIDGTAKPQNDSWSLSNDGTLTITRATSKVNINYKEPTPLLPAPRPTASPSQQPTSNPNNQTPQNSPIPPDFTLAYILVAAVAVLIIAVAALIVWRKK